MTEVKNLLLERRKLISSHTTISDLKQEINNLKEDIHQLKEKNVTIEIRLTNNESLKEMGNSSESSSYEEESKDLDFLKILNFGDHPNAFWNREKHVVSLPYEDNFSEDNIPTKARPCQMNSDYLELCKKQIGSLLQKGLIRHSKYPWSCTISMLIKMLNKKEVRPGYWQIQIAESNRFKTTFNVPMGQYAWTLCHLV
ncbi:hypothetical protein H5410_061402 [Solanum commersonii]|uniref:Reverse transcriptase n=1 Tax=Solanum commersonii TaxID=4109 RepID=A0A9J5W8S2_SOLCO|nr:hypothetical protein H5410_061402 [Solanum commersonii]